MKKVWGFFRHMSKKQMVIASSVASGILLAVVLVAVGVYWQSNKKSAMADAVKSQEKPKTEIQIEIPETEAEAQEVVVQTRTLSISGTSIERDLKVKIEDENSQLVTGTAFKIFVSQSGNESKEKEYTDEDMDGIIHIQNLEGGTYTVRLQEMEGVTVVQNPITVQVKDKIAYKKVNVSNEVKKESEIDVKKEDTAANKVPEEKPITNTLPLLSSKKEEVPVRKDEVATNLFPKSEATGESRCVIGNTSIVLPAHVTLYRQGSEDSRNYVLQMMQSGVTRGASIKELKWSNGDPSIFNMTEDDGGTLTVAALKCGTATLTLIVDYEDEGGVRAATTVTTGDFGDGLSKSGECTFRYKRKSVVFGCRRDTEGNLEGLRSTGHILCSSSVYRMADLAG